MARAQYFNRAPDEGLMHPAEVNAARLLSKQIAPVRASRQPVAYRKATTIAIPAASAPAPSASVQISTANPIGETVGAAAAAGITGLAADAGHVHAMPIGVPVSIGSANSAGASGAFADAAHIHALGPVPRTEFLTIALAAAPVAATDNTISVPVPYGPDGVTPITWTFALFVSRVETAPAGGPLTSTVKKNGVTILAANLSIAAAATTAQTNSFATTTCVSGDLLKISWGTVNSAANYSGYLLMTASY
jgi:hypothetical protein